MQSDVVRQGAGEEPDGSDEESDDSLPDLVDPEEWDDIQDTSSDDDDEDPMTDDGVEAEVEHGEEQYAWKQSKAWEDEAEEDEFVRACAGTSKWTVPPKRDQVRSMDTGPEQNC